MVPAQSDLLVRHIGLLHDGTTRSRPSVKSKSGSDRTTTSIISTLILNTFLPHLLFSIRNIYKATQTRHTTDLAVIAGIIYEDFMQKDSSFDPISHLLSFAKSPFAKRAPIFMGFLLFFLYFLDIGYFPPM